MMKQTILILSVSAVLLAGCKAEKGVRDDGVVRFTAYQPSSTKVTGTSFDQMDEIAIFAPKSGNGSSITGPYEETGFGMTKDKRYVADNSNHFTAKTESDKIRYSTAESQMDFYAVYPAMGPGPKFAVVDQTNFDINLGDISDQSKVGKVVPYMYSNNAKGKGPGSGEVALIFRYVFSKVSIEVDYDRDMIGDTLSKVEVYADGGLYRECVIDLKKGVYTDLATNGGLNTLATSDEPYKFWSPLKEDNKTWGYIVPGTAVNPMIRLTFGDPTVTIGTGTGGGATAAGKVYTCKIPIDKTGGVFQAGKEYRYTVQIGSDTEVGIGGTIEDWEVVGNEYPPIVAQ